MRDARKYLIGTVVLAGLWGPDARAGDGEPTPPAPPTTAAGDTKAPPEAGVSGELTDEELAKLAAAETIEVFAERPDKPFDRDTELRLTGEQLAKRGATDLGTALALLSDVIVRDAGRGGFNIDVRGGRKSAVSIFIDGVLVSDPYYGTFDVSSIPITDIVQIRVATTPQSPIDGPGGPGGVIEVHTRDAVGPTMVVGRVAGDSLKTLAMSATGRTALTKHLALRLAATGTAGARDLETATPMTIAEDRQAGTGSSRLEYRKGDRRLVLDGFLDSRHYISPPSDVDLAPGANLSILLIDRETTMRASVLADDKIGKLSIQGQTWIDRLARRSMIFRDVALTDRLSTEDLTATRVGGRTLISQPLGKDLRWAASATLDHQAATVIAGDTSEGSISLGELAVDGQYEHGPIRIDLAGGVALPVGVSADPWPEGKLAVRYRPVRDLELTATTGYKGRVPSLRERFDAATGNPALGPEFARHAEVRAIWEGLRTEALGGPGDARPRVRFELAPFTRKTTGTSRLCVTADQCPGGMVGKLAALDDAFFYGLDAVGRVRVARQVEVGGAYNYIKGCELESGGCGIASVDGGGADPLDRLPRHRADGWIQVSPIDRVNAVTRTKYFGRAFDKGDRTGAYVLLEASVSVQIGKAYLGVLRVDDALDARPETRAGFHMPGRVVSFVFQGTWE